MIIRVFTEGQYEVRNGALAQLRKLDEECEAAIVAGDEKGFRTSYDALLKLLRDVGTPLADDDLRSSDLMFPPPDVTLAEAQRDFSEHGLIPD